MNVEIGKKYRHYKGNEYLVLTIARSSEEIGEQFVVYQDLSDASKIWTRQREMFEEEVEIDGKKMQRFTPIE